MAIRHLVGLDIGSKFIKALQLTETKEGYKITDYAQTEVAPNEPPTGAMARLFAERKFKTKRVATAVSGRSVFIRYITMALMSDEELFNAAKFELGKYIPVEVDELIHDCYKLEEPPPQEGQEPEMRVVLVAAKRAFIDEHVALLEGAGLQPAVIDVDSFALGNCHELGRMANPEAAWPDHLIALVDIGAQKTNVNIMGATLSYFTREFYKGGDDLTDALSKKMAIDLQEAERIKRNPEEQAPRVQECLTTLLEDISHDINLSLDYFENQYDKKVEEIWMTGGSALTPGLYETLEKTASKKVTVWDPVLSIAQEMDPPSLEMLKANSKQAVIALGLASRLIQT